MNIHELNLFFSHCIMNKLIWKPKIMEIYSGKKKYFINITDSVWCVIMRIVHRKVLSV